MGRGGVKDKGERERDEQIQKKEEHVTAQPGRAKESVGDK